MVSSSFFFLLFFYSNSLCFVLLVLFRVFQLWSSIFSLFLFHPLKENNKKETTTSTNPLSPTSELSIPQHPTQFSFQKKIMDADSGIVWNGQVTATMGQQGKWKHLRRQDVVNIAPGMDVLLAVGMCYVRLDKSATDQEVAADAVAGAV